MLLPVFLITLMCPTDCSFLLDELSGVGVGGCGVYSLKSGAGWFGRRWGHLEVIASW